MRGEIKMLAKAAVTGLVKPDDLVVQAGHMAIDKLFAWLPGKDKSQLEQLIEEVAGDLQKLADKEFDGNTDLEPAVGNATILFERHGLSAGDLIALNLDPARATNELLDRGAAIFSTLEPSVADLCGKHIVPRVMQRLLVDRRFLEDLSPTITKTVLERLDDIRQLVVQLIDDDNAVTVAGAAALKLTRYPSRRRPDGLREDDKEIRLLSPFTQAIPLLGRESEQEALRAWLKSDRAISIHVLTGRAGSGKTRLALDLCDEIAAGAWQAGFVNGNHLAGFCEGAGAASWAWGQPTLVVMDDAAAHAATLRNWFGQLVDYAGDCERPLRILLLERHAEAGLGWWKVAFGRGGWQDHEIQSRLDPADPVELRTIGEREQRSKIFAHALQAAGSDKAPPGPGKDAYFDQKLTELTWGGEPLFLMMAGLVAKNLGVGHVLSLGRTDLALALAKNELARIRALAEANAINPDFLEAMAGYVSLCGGLDHKVLLAVVPEEQRVLGLPSAGDPGKIAGVLRTALPGSKGFIDPILPDMIGDAAVIVGLTEYYDDSLSAVLRAFEQGGSLAAATVVRIAQNFGEIGQDGPLAWLCGLLERTDVYVDQLMLVANELPSASLSSAPYAVKINDVIVTSLRAQLENDASSAFVLHLASALNNLAFSLGRLGRWGEAIDAAKESASLFEELAEAEPSIYRARWATSLANLAWILGELGRWEEALETARQAEGVFRDLAGTRPDDFLPELAGSLQRIAVCFDALDRPNDAWPVAQEALETLAPCFFAEPPLFGSQMEITLKTYDRCCERSGTKPNSEFAVQVLRELQSLWKRS